MPCQRGRFHRMAVSMCQTGFHAPSLRRTPITRRRDNALRPRRPSSRLPRCSFPQRRHRRSQLEYSLLSYPLFLSSSFFQVPFLHPLCPAAFSPTCMAFSDATLSRRTQLHHVIGRAGDHPRRGNTLPSRLSPTICGAHNAHAAAKLMYRAAAHDSRAPVSPPAPCARATHLTHHRQWRGLAHPRHHSRRSHSRHPSRSDTHGPPPDVHLATSNTMSTVAICGRPTSPSEPLQENRDRVHPHDQYERHDSHAVES
ncbi:hypothetical protein C8R45DRAFT_594118 [Mycena sanguinolenta]|nr:hypothetical protein C8R45DRAFT_594118 [Mycena sanguinolenta]